MFNKLRNFNLDNFLDTKIAEEEAKKRQGQPSGPRRQASAARRPNGRTDSPKGAPIRSREPDGVPAKGPDPSEFVIDDDEVSTRAPTPIPPEKTVEDGGTVVKEGAEPADSKEATGTITGQTSQTIATEKKPATAEELTPEVQSKLKRLQKLEAKYHELLRSYRVAHARISVIEPFEASLRESTPLTSINDPTALVEYLAQLNLKSEMIMSELKKVTEDCNNAQNKQKQAEEQSKRAEQELATLREEQEAAAKNVAEVSQTPSEKKDDDLFSYDEEVPRLQEELKTTADRVEALLSENEKLRTELEELRRSHSEEMEATMNQSSTDKDVAAQNEKLESRLKVSSKALNEATAVFDEIATQLSFTSSNDTSLSDKLQGLATSVRETQRSTAGETTRLAERLKAVENDLKVSNSNIESAQLELNSANEKSDKKVATMDSLVKTLRDQLTEAAKTKQSLEKDLSSMQDQVKSLEQDGTSSKQQAAMRDDATVSSLRDDISRLERELDGAFELLVSSGAVSELELSTASVQDSDATASATQTPPENGTTNASVAAKKKSKNKKKKKGPGAANATEESTDAQSVDGTVKVEAAATASPPVPSVVASKLTAEQIARLKAKIAGSVPPDSRDTNITELKQKLSEQATRLESLNAEIAEKSSTIDRLHSKLKGEEDLREEIEGLKDDLMHIGNDHVGAKDQIKALQAAKAASDAEHADTIKTVEGRCQDLKKQIASLEADLESQKEDSVKLQAELEALRTSSGFSGKELETQVASAKAEKEALGQRITSTEKDKTDAVKRKDELEGELSVLRGNITSLQIDLNVVNELAQTRFKDLSSLRERLGKIQPEVNKFKTESERLKQANADLTKDNEKLRQLEARSESLKSEVSTLKTRLQDKETEARTLTEKARKAEQRAIESDDKEHRASRAQNRAETLQKDAVEARDRASKELSKCKEELDNALKRVQDLDNQVTSLRTEARSAKDEMALKAAQQASAQSLMDTMQDQTRELATQMKELKGRCDNLEEELADSQRLLMERGREGETMRRLLADVEGKAEARVKEMRDRLELATEERDRAEEDASTMTRRKARESEELRSKLREAEKQRNSAVEERDEFERKASTGDTQSKSLQKKAADAQKELDEIRAAMAQLRDALDDGERQRRELEKERQELKKGLEEKEKRLDKVQKGSKTMAEELKSLQSQVKVKSAVTHPASLDSPPAQNGAVGKNGVMDYKYLKTVLLQFLEQKDRKHQMQLVPVLGMLLHFDGTDEQKWMTAINAK